MTVLLTKQARDSLGIDTVTRGLVWAALYLKAVNLERKTAYKDYIQWTLAATNTSARFNAEIKLIYNRLNTTTKALDFIPNILAFTELDVSTPFNLDTPNSEELPDTLPTEPANVTTLEKYLYWLSSILVASTYPNTSYCKFDIFDSATVNRHNQIESEPYIKITLFLPLNYKKYLISGNVIFSVERIVDNYLDQISEVPNEPIFTPINNTVNWATINNKPNFATVATSGSYLDLSNKPSIPALLGQMVNDVQFITAAGVPLKTVNNLSPDTNGNINITTALGEAHWSVITNKPNFHPVATSGSYTDLVHKPFIPTQLSELSNDTQFITFADVPVLSVNGQTGDVTVSGGSSGARELLTADRTYYARTNGNDNNDGLTNTQNGAFASVQKAIDVVSALDLKGYNVTITVNTGTYNLQASLSLKDPVGEGAVTINTVGTVIFQSSSATNTIYRGLIECIDSKKYVINGVKLVHIYKSQLTSWNVSLHIDGGKLKIQNINFGNLYDAEPTFTKHILVEGNGKLSIEGNYSISGASGSSNNNANHINCRSGGIVDYIAGATTVAITNTPTFAIFIVAESTGLAQVWNTTFTGSVSSNCKKYHADTNGVLKTWGSTIFPGSINGTTVSGGQAD